MKSQTSFETLIIMAVMIVIILILLVFNTDLSTTFSSKYSKDQIKNSLEEIANAAELSYNQGLGAKNKVYISLPNIIINSTVSNRTLTFNVYSNINEDGYVPIYKNLNFNVTGSLPNTSGNHWIILESQGGFVNVSK